MANTGAALARWHELTDIQFLKGQPPNLALGTQFRWKTFGITIVSSVLEFEPNERLAWDAHRSGFDAYHAWLIQKTASGCTVITEETQRGWLARFARALRPQQMEKQHQIWLEGLSAGASAGYPRRFCGLVSWSLPHSGQNFDLAGIFVLHRGQILSRWKAERGSESWQ